MQDLGVWLDSIGLGNCLALLTAQDIDLDVLRELTESDLEHAGLSLGQRRKLRHALEHDHRLPAPVERAERRQLTVVFCDLVESTALSTRLDPEDFRDIIRLYLREITTTVEKFGGYVARYMGDGVLVYFGWPQAQEDAAEQAVRAGLAVVKSVANVQLPASPLAVRVGIATGIVVMGDATGTGRSRRQQVAVGEAPNLAARLQSVATPGAVLISDATRRLVGDLFVLHPVGPFDLKGFAAPVRPWQVTSEQDSASRFVALRRPARGDIVNRRDELALLEDAWAATRNGTGAVVLLTGEPGIGKTRIVESFSEAHRGEYHLRLCYQCLPNHQNSILHPVIRAITRAARFEVADTERVKLEKLRALLLESGPVTDEAFACFAGILSLTDPHHLHDDDVAQQRRARTIEALIAYLAALAQRRPILLQFEDAQWGDPTTLELADCIVRHAASLPLLLVATARPDFAPAWLGAAHVTHRVVTRLGRDDSAAMIRGTIGGRRMSARIEDHIISKSDGIPLFIEEITKAALEAGNLAQADNDATSSIALPPIGVPSTLQDSLTARLDRLGSVKDVAQTAAVIGRDFAQHLLASVIGVAPAQLEDALRRLCDAQLVTKHGNFPDSVYSFRHALIHDAAYAGLLLSERRVLHASVARVLEADFAETCATQPELLAYHYGAARQAEHAVRWWHRAGRRSTQAAAYGEALDQFTRCLEQLALLPQTEERDKLEAAVRIDFGMPLIARGGYTSAAMQANLQRIGELDQRTQGVTQFPPLAGRVAMAFSSSDMVTAAPLAQQFLASAEEVGDRQLRMIGHWLVGITLTGAGELVAASTHLEKSLALNEPEHDGDIATTYGIEPRVAVLASQAVVLYRLGFPEMAAAKDAASMAHAAQYTHPATTTYATTLHVFFLMLCGNDAALGPASRALLDLAQRQASPLHQGMAEAILDLLQASVAPSDLLFVRARAVIDKTRALGWNLLFCWLSLFEARVCLRQARFAAAEHALDAMQALVEPHGHDVFLPELFRLRASLALHGENAVQKAEQHLRRSMRIAAGQAARVAEMHAAADLQEKQSFFEKKDQKTFVSDAVRTRSLIALAPSCPQSE